MTRADLRAQMRCTCFNYNERKRVKGIEPSCAAWEAAVLPLNYTRMMIFDFRLAIDDLQAHGQSLPRNNVVGLNACSRIFVDVIAVRSRPLISAIRPCDYTLRDRIDPSSA